MPRFTDMWKKTGLKPDVVRLQGKMQKLTAPYGVFCNPVSPEKRNCQSNEQRTSNSAESPLKQTLGTAGTFWAGDPLQYL